MKDGGRFSNDKYSKVADASNTFILQDDCGISLIDVEKKDINFVQRVMGSHNDGIFIEKREEELVIHTNQMNYDKNHYLTKREYLRI